MPRRISQDEMQEIADRILSFIRSEMLTKGFAPSVREIGKATGVKSTATIYKYLSRLEDMGLMRRDASKPRALEILDIYQVRPIAMVPVLGQVTAGVPILAIENIVGHLPVPEHIQSKGEIYALKIRGDSMIEAGILDGDFIYVCKQNSASNGEIVVALLEDEATVKYYYSDPKGIMLQPANPAYEPIYTRECTILGRVMGLYREFI
ncbi:MAG: transcriptional repressor LexA [Symbiobacteriaceae bacterium]|nr:transcriptional repressor LexA [Symbiobacteriaceae bacterium]